MPHMGQPGFGAKDISRDGCRWRRASSVVPTHRRGHHVSASDAMLLSPSATTSISSAFEAFREHLDDHYDRRERLIKVYFSATFWIFVLSVGYLGKPRCICRLEESHLSSSTNLERGVRRRPRPFSPRCHRSEKEVGRSSCDAEERCARTRRSELLALCQQSIQWTSRVYRSPELRSLCRMRWTHIL
jgi:hypothetical protein